MHCMFQYFFQVRTVVEESCAEMRRVDHAKSLYDHPLVLLLPDLTCLNANRLQSLEIFLEQPPQALNRIKLRRVGWQPDWIEAVFFHTVVHHWANVCLGIVPNHIDSTWQLRKADSQVLEEAHHVSSAGRTTKLVWHVIAQAFTDSSVHSNRGVFARVDYSLDVHFRPAVCGVSAHPNVHCCFVKVNHWCPIS